MNLDKFNFPNITSSLQSTFPALSPIAPLTVLGEGFSSLAVETPAGIVFRIPRTPEAGQRYAREFQLLPLLKAHLPVAIPEPRWYLPSSDDFPFGVIGYPKLPGRSLDFDDLLNPALQPAYAAQMASILAALHQTQPNLLPLADHWPDLYLSWQKQRAVVMPALKESLQPDEYQRVQAWWQEFLSEDSMRAYTPVIMHGDFWFGNLLVEETRITGIVDFENLALGDAVIDFVPLLYLGEGFLRQVLAFYIQQGGAVDAGFEHRLRHLWAVREFGGLEYAIQYQDQVEYEESLVKLRKGPILSPAGLDGW